MAATPKRLRLESPVRTIPASPLSYILLLGLKPAHPLELIRLVNRGLPFSAFERLQEALGLPAQEIADIVGIPARTLHRRKEQRRLQPDESDRLVRLARIYGMALDLFEGDQPEARHWLSSPQPGLGGASALALASTEVGAREVESLIARLEHGVFA